MKKSFLSQPWVFAVVLASIGQMAGAMQEQTVDFSKEDSGAWLGQWTLKTADTRQMKAALARYLCIGHTLHVGKIVVRIKLTNQGDLVAAQRKLSRAKPRTVQAEALVDTGATRLYLQSSLIKALGLHQESEVQSKTANGVRRRAVFEPVRLEIMGREGVFQVVEIDDDVPNLLGQIPLEYLDFVVDPRGRKLIPNPEHGDKQMSE